MIYSELERFMDELVIVNTKPSLRCNATTVSGHPIASLSTNNPDDVIDWAEHIETKFPTSNYSVEIK